MYEESIQRPQLPLKQHTLHAHGSHLDTCCPGVGVGVGSCTVKAHVVLNHVLYHKSLLQDGPIEDLGLDGQLDLKALGVRLGPDESCIDQLDLASSGSPEFTMSP